MSNALALAAVTSTIRYLLDAALGGAQPGAVGGAAVTTLHPARLVPGDGDPPKGINLFLYRTTPNHAWNLTDLPTRGSDGGLVHKPVAALDLHYLVSCTGEDAELDAQRLLGRAILALASNPSLGRDIVSLALTEYGSEVPTAFLSDADLVDSVELVKIAPETISLEDESRLWTTLGTPWLLSATYIATVVLLEPAVAPRTVLPVRERVVTVEPWEIPAIAKVVTDPPGAAIVSGLDIEVVGTGLRSRGGRVASVRVGEAELAIVDAEQPGALRTTIDDTVRAGAHGLFVVHRTTPTSPGEPARVAARSNSIPILVRPRVTSVTVGATEVTLTMSPPRFASQRAGILLTPLGAPDARRPLFITMTPLAAGSPPAPTLVFDRSGIDDGDWLVRVSVDGADSIAELDGETFARPLLRLV